MYFVIDCSYSSALFLPDEKSDDVRNFFLNINKNDTVIVPALWWYETVNVLNISVKRKRISYNTTSQIISLFDSLNFETDMTHGSNYSKKLLDLTQLYQISAYDASYLELALRQQAVLLTHDDELLQAAETSGIKVMTG